MEAFFGGGETNSKKRYTSLLCDRCGFKQEAAIFLNVHPSAIRRKGLHLHHKGESLDGTK